MPKIDIDYSNTIIYKITCNDDNIKDVYVGHTTNFVQRKHAHKQCSINETSGNCKLYKVIRDNGGWNNWKMEIINFFNCKDHYEARIKEQEYFVSLNANLNSIEPLPLPKNKLLPKPIQNETIQESQIIFDFTEPLAKGCSYSCIKCNYKTSKKFNYDEHLLTIKHQKSMARNENPANPANPAKSSDNNFVCLTCNKVYKDNSGLWRHKKNCVTITTENNVVENSVIENDVNFKELFKLQLNENKELKDMIMEQSKMMMEICKDKSFNNNITNNTNMINSHNKTFNLQFFLNETCKDAMNLSDFIDSVKIQLTDLESVGKLGFVDGISNIIIKNLEALDIEKRPIHCCDSKRETMYIKDQDKWEKEDNELKRMKELVRIIRDKNISMVNTWRDLYPECVKSDSKKTTQFNQIYMEAFGGEKGTKKEKEEKIISKIAKSVIIDKYE